MDTFESRAYNKQIQAEHDECMKENNKGIILNGKATDNKGSCQYPTDKDRELDIPGEGADRLIEDY